MNKVKIVLIRKEQYDDEEENEFGTINMFNDIQLPLPVGEILHSDPEDLRGRLDLETNINHDDVYYMALHLYLTIADSNRNYYQLNSDGILHKYTPGDELPHDADGIMYILGSEISKVFPYFQRDDLDGYDEYHDSILVLKKVARMLLYQIKMINARLSGDIYGILVYNIDKNNKVELEHYFGQFYMPLEELKLEAKNIIKENYPNG